MSEHMNRKEYLIMIFSKKKFSSLFSKGMVIPKTAQDTIPFYEVYENGIFLVGEDRYTLIFSFENLDYSLLRENEQMDTYQDCISPSFPFNILNSFMIYCASTPSYASDESDDSTKTYRLFPFLTCDTRLLPFSSLKIAVQLKER